MLTHLQHDSHVLPSLFFSKEQPPLQNIDLDQQAEGLPLYKIIDLVCTVVMKIKMIPY